jgi:acetoin utilization deacetylase AcuC-like enzyme/GNAT superfamily N-acetyltransferase
MFRIRRIFDDSLPVDREAVARVQDMLRQRFGTISEKEVMSIPGKLRDPLKYRFRTILFVAERKHEVAGFALVLHAPDVHFCYLDYLSVMPGKAGGGVGGALYERVRGEAASLDSAGVFFECLPDDPALCRDKSIRAENRSRLAFYERYGARPVAGTRYETPLKAGDDCPPYLVFDGLDTKRGLARDTARAVVRAILERKYGRRCPPGYIDDVVNSFNDDPVRLREPRYAMAGAPSAPPARKSRDAIALAVNDNHDIHHVHERGYVESPVRINAILKRLEATGLFERLPVRHFSEDHILAVHERRFVNYLKKVSKGLSGKQSVYPYVFPVRNAARPPKELPVRAGYFCIDTFTPLNENAYLAAKRAVDCALTCADSLLSGRRMAYALVRPPGHHAERRVFGGFCYFNSGAVAAHYLSRHGRVAVLDIDYHHGNGTQDIFYERGDVLTVSIHGHPSFAYPYFSGFADEKGVGFGSGCNINYPLAEHVDGETYAKTLGKALSRIVRFSPTFLVVCLGLDTAKGDPTGTWSISVRDFETNGRMIGALQLPTLVVQEGGYKIPSLGANTAHFFSGLALGMAVGREKRTNSGDIQ